MNRIDYLREGIKNLKTMGTIARSSRQLCKNMVSHVNFSDAELIVELGAGDGVITKYILRKLKPDAKLLVFEVNPKFCMILRQIKYPRLILAEASAEKLGEYVEKMGFTKVDYVISAIPFVVLPKQLGLDIIGKCHDYLKKGGRFVQLHYSLVAKNIYERIFGNVNISFVPINIPPAFVLVSEKR